MATVKGMHITKGPNYSSSVGDGYLEQLNIYNLSVGGNWSSKYFHFKTNQRGSFNTIVTIEGVGYNYGRSRPIKCMWSFYAWNGIVYDKGMNTDAESGVDAHGMYMSSDGYVVVRAYTASHYVCGMMLNAYTSGAGAHNYTDIIEIIEVSVNDTSGNHY